MPLKTSQVILTFAHFMCLMQEWNLWWLFKILCTAFWNSAIKNHKCQIETKTVLYLVISMFEATSCEWYFSDNDSREYEGMKNHNFSAQYPRKPGMFSYLTYNSRSNWDHYFDLDLKFGNLVYEVALNFISCIFDQCDA
jgi:hypothetical protein